MELDLLALLAEAVRAPSSHNTQPWRFALHDRAIEVHADRTRALPQNDPEGRELTISLGAVIGGIKHAAASRKLETEIALLPDSSSPDHWATIAIAQPDAAASDAGPPVANRFSVRGAFHGRGVPPSFSDRLQVLAGAYPECHLRVLGDDSARAQLAALVAEGDRRQFANAPWRRELAHWMRPHPAPDGLRVPALAGWLIRAAVRHINLGRFVAATDEKLARQAPLLLVLWSDHDQPRAWLQAGMLLTAISCEAAAMQLHEGYLNQPCQVADLRRALAQQLNIGGYPQLVLRLGYPRRAPTPSPRRNPATTLLR